MAAVNPYQQSAIKNLAFPEPASQVAPTLRAQKDMGIQKVAQQQTKSLTTPTDSTMMGSRVAGAALQAQAGQGALANAAQSVQSSARVGQTALATRESDVKNQVALRKLSLDAEANKASARLSRLGEDVKNQILDDNLSFQRDKMGRTRFNERQLADWVVLKANKTEDFENFKQKSALYHERNMQIMNQSYKVIESELQQYTNKTLTMQDLSRQKILAKAQAAMKKKMSEEANRRSQGAAMGKGIGMVVGGIIGVVAGWGVGSVPLGIAGAGIGGSLGESAGASMA
jgi:hypothetical protein